MSANELYARRPDCGFIAPPEATNYWLTAASAIGWSRPTECVAHPSADMPARHHELPTRKPNRVVPKPLAAWCAQL